MGIVSKKDLEGIIAKANNFANFNQWTNTITAIYWIKIISNKRVDLSNSILPTFTPLLQKICWKNQSILQNVSLALMKK